MIRICFAGITGWTRNPSWRPSPKPTISRGRRSRAKGAGQTLTDVTDLPFDGQVFAGVAEALQTVEADVVIDYTSATAVAVNVRAAIEAGTHVVIGSSGLTSEDYAELDTLAQRIPSVLSLPATSPSWPRS